MSLPKITALVAGVALAMPLAAVSATASAGTAPPPCKNKAISQAVEKSLDGPITLDGKRCKNYWAAAQFVIDGEGAAAMLEDNGGVWKVVGSKREAKYCKPSNKTVPNKIKNYACVS
jgi:hypothetical protein